MHEPDWTNCSEEDLWKYVAYNLEKEGVETVLVGGAVVAIYTEGLYRSGDLDLVPSGFDRKRLEEQIQALGFIPTGRYFKHPACHHLMVEFPKGPVELGDEYPVIPDVIEYAGQRLKLLSPTSCVKDRLASYIYFKQRDTFDQAVLVCLRQKGRIDWKDLRNWCQSEGSPEVFEELRKAVSE